MCVWCDYKVSPITFNRAGYLTFIFHDRIFVYELLWRGFSAYLNHKEILCYCNLEKQATANNNVIAVLKRECV